MGFNIYRNTSNLIYLSFKRIVLQIIMWRYYKIFNFFQFSWKFWKLDFCFIEPPTPRDYFHSKIMCIWNIQVKFGRTNRIFTPSSSLNIFLRKAITCPFTYDDVHSWYTIFQSCKVIFIFKHHIWYAKTNWLRLHKYSHDL